MYTKNNNQEKFWKGKFGDLYINRNKSKNKITNNIHFFKKALSKANKINSVCELGSNIGLNILALKDLYKKKLKKILSVEINERAFNIQKKKIKNIKILNTSINSLDVNEQFDLVLCKGILIHINPKNLYQTYKKMNKLSKKYILIAEYFNPSPIKINYRGYKDKLFKRDFAKEYLKINKKSKLLDYGFIYEKDKFPQDNITWFLIKK